MKIYVVVFVVHLILAVIGEESCKISTCTYNGGECDKTAIVADPSNNCVCDCAAGTSGICCEVVATGDSSEESSEDSGENSETVFCPGLKEGEACDDGTTCTWSDNTCKCINNCKSPKDGRCCEFQSCAKETCKSNGGKCADEVSVKDPAANCVCVCGSGKSGPCCDAKCATEGGSEGDNEDIDCDKNNNGKGKAYGKCKSSKNSKSKHSKGRSSDEERNERMRLERLILKELIMEN